MSNLEHSTGEDEIQPINLPENQEKFEQILHDPSFLIATENIVELGLKLHPGDRASARNFSIQTISILVNKMVLALL